jgi:uncharacterized protein YbjT (DUF2867 family)
MEALIDSAFTGAMTNTTSTTSTDPTGAPTPGLTVVTGGTGKTGRRVVDRLAALGLPHRVGSRREAPPFEWGDPDTWPAVLDGASSAYIAYYPDVAFPGAVDTIGAFAAQAVRQGVRRLVLLSGRGEEEALVSEQAVRDSGADWTILRATWFAQDFSEHFLLGPVLGGVIALPAGDVAEPLVDAEDIADVAVAALTAADDRHVGQVYELTGPRLITFAEAAATISAAIGRDVTYVPVTPAEYEAGAVDAGVPAEEAAPLAELFSRVLDGRNAHLADGVERALGRPPRDFADFVRAAATSGVWQA